MTESEEPAPQPGRRSSFIDSPVTLSILLGVVAVIRTAYLFGLGRFVPYTGDESFYIRTADNVLELLRGTGQNPLESIIGRGWFMPGMNTILLPVSQTDSVLVVRLYISLIAFGLLVLITYRIRAMLGARASLVFVALIGITPAVTMFSATLWGEVIGASALLLIILAIGRVTLGERDMRLRTGIGLGIALAALIYIRPSYILFSIVVGLSIALLGLDTRPWRSAIRTTGPVLLAVILVTGLLIAPWSIALSAQKGGFFLTTTSLDLNVVITFAADEDLAPILAGGSRFVAIDEHVIAESQRLDIPYAESIKNLRREMLQSVSFSDYRQSVQSNLELFFLSDSEFPGRFVRTSAANGGPELGSARLLLFDVNHAIWLILMWAGFALFAFPLNPKRENWHLAWLYKASFLALTIQPFVSIATGRYYVGLVFLIAFGLAAASSRASARTALPSRARYRGLDLGETVVAAFQVACLALFCGVLAVFWF